MDRVAAAAGVSKTTLHSRFPSKKDVFDAVVRREVGGFRPSFEPEAIRDLLIGEALTHIILHTLEAMPVAEKRRLERSMFQEVSRHPELRQAFVDSVVACEMTAFTRCFERASARGEIDVEDASFAAAFFYSLLKGRHISFVVTGIVTDLSSEERTSLARRASRTLVHGIGGRRGGGAGAPASPSDREQPVCGQ